MVGSKKTLIKINISISIYSINITLDLKRDYFYRHNMLYMQINFSKHFETTNVKQLPASCANRS